VRLEGREEQAVVAGPDAVGGVDHRRVQVDAQLVLVEHLQEFLLDGPLAVLDEELHGLDEREPGADARGERRHAVDDLLVELLAAALVEIIEEHGRPTIIAIGRA